MPQSLFFIFFYSVNGAQVTSSNVIVVVCVRWRWRKFGFYIHINLIASSLESLNELTKNKKRTSCNDKLDNVKFTKQIIC